MTSPDQSERSVPERLTMRRCPDCGAISSPGDSMFAHDWRCEHDFDEAFDGYETLTYVHQPTQTQEV